MDLKPPQCRLCRTQSPIFLNIFIEKILDKTIANILSQHFWFEVKEDELNEYICHDCWIKVNEFHLFYTKVYNIHFLDLHTKVIKVEIDDDSLINKENKELGTDLEIKSESNLDVNTNQEGDEQNTCPQSELCDDETSSDIEDKDDRSSNESSVTTPSQILINAVVKTRKSKTVKIVREKKEIDPMKQEKFNTENMQISEYYSMACELCSLKLDSLRNLQYHYRTEHKTKGYVRCCNRKFFKRATILEHLMRHLNPQIIKCEICDKTFARKYCLQLHLRSHLPAGERPYKCAQCPKTYVIAHHLKRHLQTHTTERSFVCGECGKACVTEYQLKDHQRSMHSEASAHICDVCAKPFRSKDMFVKHHEIVHGKVPLPKVQCNLCGSWVKHKYLLKKHIARHSESNKHFSCNICGKSSPSSDALRSHIRYVHTEKLYKCEICEKTFKKSTGLKEHMAYHTGASLYSCTYCSRTFNSSANMYAHRKKMHNREWEKEKLEKLNGN